MLTQRKLFLFLALCLATSWLRGETMSLGGAWGFALDPQRRGEASGWPALQMAAGKNEWTGWDTVTVPHSWSGDARYEHTGAAWYVRRFEVPETWKDSHFRLRFTSVGDRCRVWVNGQLVGSHDGVNLPFSLDVTSQVKRTGPNTVVLEIDNSFNDATIPGSRPGTNPASQLYPWWNYGGILGDIALESEAPDRVSRWKTSYVFEKDGAVNVTVRTSIENRGATDTQSLEFRMVAPSGKEVATATVPAVVAAGKTGDFTLTCVVPAAQVQRWDLDHPVLYTATVKLTAPEGSAVMTRRLGLREIAVRDGQLLLNNEPVRVAGANRARGHLTFGGLEPAALVEQDMTLLKRAHLEFARLQHYPISTGMLDWADAHGMLIIAEAGNWQFTPAQLSSPEMRKLWRQHMQELIETSWDRPSVVAWSVGNEYNSWSPEGIAWTKDMAEWVRTLDQSRPVTFAALGTELNLKETDKTKRSFNYVDLICSNFYGDPKQVGVGLDRVHGLWPDKPIMISEFGVRSDLAKDEAARIEHLAEMLRQIRARPFICGLSYWAFNDYLSRYPGTTPGGYRAWGLVRADRTPRELYTAACNELSPGVVRLETNASGGKPALTVSARADFPSGVLRDYAVRITPADGGAPTELRLPTLVPGQNWSAPSADFKTGSKIELLRPDGLTAFVLSPEAGKF